MNETPTSSKPSDKPRVLAVDDQGDALRLLQLRLLSSGLDCRTCTDGESALELLAKEPFDLVILDVMMPRMDGFEVCQRIKENEKLKDIPIIFLTARLDPTDRIRGLQAGGHDYLNKPVDLQELIARTRAALRVKQLQDELKGKILLQQQINQLQKDRLIEHWQKTLGQLAASLAHEINNPLAAALGNVQFLLMDQQLTEDVHRRVQNVEESLCRAGHNLRSLLLIAQSGNASQTTAIESIIDDIITLTNYIAVVSKVQIVKETGPEVKWKGEPSVLARAILYIVNNAIEACAERPEARVVIRTEHDSESHTIRICDNGPGIDPAIHDRMFVPFFTTKEHPHNGVGLHLAAEAIQSVGGTVRFASPSGNFATEFTINFPRSVAENRS